MKGLLRRVAGRAVRALGPRWSLHEKGDPQRGMTLALQYNIGRQLVPLAEHDFDSEGKPTDDLWARIDAADPTWMGEPHLEVGEFQWREYGGKRPVERREVERDLYK